MHNLNFPTNFNCGEFPYEVVAQSWETRYSWGHVAAVRNTETWDEHCASVRYYNRTWECYKYQSVIHCAIDKAIDAAMERAVDEFKRQNGRLRIKAAERAEIRKNCDAVRQLQALRSYIDEQNTHKY